MSDSMGVSCLMVGANKATCQELSDATKRQYAARTQDFFDGLKFKDMLPAFQPAIAKLQLNEDLVAPLPPEVKVKANGLYYSHNWRFSAGLSMPQLARLYSDPVIRIVSGADILDAGRTKSLAEEFVRSNFPWFFEKDVPKVLAEGPDAGGDYSFTWQKYQLDGLPDTRVWVNIRSLDGKINGFSSSRFSGPWEHKLTANDAKTKAVEFYARDAKLTNVEAVRYEVSGGGGKTWYAVLLRSVARQNGESMVTGVEVDANDGTVFPSIEGWHPATSKVASSVADRTPLWTKAGLVFVSNRKPASLPSWAISPPQMYIRTAEGEIRNLTSDLKDGDITGLRGDGMNSWVAFNWHGWTYGLDMRQGKTLVLGTPDRPAAEAILASAGDWSVSCGTGHTGAPDRDLLTYPTVEGAPLGIRGRLLIPVSHERFPCYSPDGKWIYFVSTKLVKDQAESSLRRVLATDAQGASLRSIAPERIFEVVPSVPSDINRLSIASDGSCLVLQAASGVMVVDIAKRQLKTISLPALKDPEPIGIPLADIKDATSGPAPEELTFSAKTVDGKLVSRRRIYSCRFDGSNLKAWTPLDNIPVAPFVFAQGHQSVSELGQTIALREIEWEETKH